jgi:very-short-patch-repair endonuclease
MPDKLLTYARDMRRHQTAPETILWVALRNRQLTGLKFRRQVPLGPYIADFYCPSARLVIEIDGATHADPAIDRDRDAWMLKNDIRVLRFWNKEVTANVPGVLARFSEVGALAPLPRPLPQGEGRRTTTPG